MNPQMNYMQNPQVQSWPPPPQSGHIQQPSQQQQQNGNNPQLTNQMAGMNLGDQNGQPKYSEMGQPPQQFQQLNQQQASQSMMNKPLQIQPQGLPNGPPQPPLSQPMSMGNQMNNINNSGQRLPPTGKSTENDNNGMGQFMHPPNDNIGQYNHHSQMQQQNKIQQPPNMSGQLPPMSSNMMPNANKLMQPPFGMPQQQQNLQNQQIKPPMLGANPAGQQFQQQPQMQFPGQQPLMSQQKAPITGQLPPLPGQQQSGSELPMSGQLPPAPGHMPPMPGQMAPMSGQIPPMPGQISSMPGQMPPMAGQMPSMGGQMRGMPPMPSQQSQMSDQLPPMAGQLPAMPGQPGMMPPNQHPSYMNQMPGQPMYPGQQPQFANQMPNAGHLPPGNKQGSYAQPGVYNNQAGQYPQPNLPQMGAPQMSAQQRRLDPDQMPNPIQVMSENQRSYDQPFVTNQIGLIPPLVTTKYTTQDQGNSGPRYIRSSMYNVAVSSDMIKQTAVPFSLIISPFARTVEGELAPPIVDFGELGPIRCIRCKAYICPNMQFIDGGRRFQCLLCKASSEVPAEYFQHLDHTGQRVDKYERPELVLGTYEFVATKDYCRNNTPPKPPAIIFVIDVSYNNVKSGLVNLLCSEIKNIIKHLPIDEGAKATNMKVGFITYNNTVHFYNIKSLLAQPQMMVVGDLQEMFMPLLDGFLCDPNESMSVIDSLMEQIPKMFNDTRETETILLPAIQAGLEALKASECCGKLLIFHSTLPIVDAPGRLKNRDDRKLLGTDKEKNVLVPQCTTYNNLGQECVQAGCSVDLFLFNNSYIDIATIGQISRLTGGEVYKYTYFQSDIDGQRLINDVIKNLSRPIAFDTVMRVRTSTGIRPTDFYGHFFMSNTTDMEIAAIDSDKSIAIEIKHDDKLAPEDNVYIQVALLYTSVGGQRRLRILNLALKACTQMTELFRCCDLDTIILFLAKQSMVKLLEHTPKLIKDGLVNRCAQILACYRKNCASPTSAGQLILPECMKLLPLYTSCLLKNDAISGGSDITLDDRSFVMQMVSTMDLNTSVTYFYPRLIPIHDIEPNENDIPYPIRCSIEKMQENGAYILENGIYMFMWLGLGLAPEFVQSVFGVQCTQQIDTDRVTLPIFDNPLSRRVRGVVDGIQKEKNRCMRLTLVRQRDKLENVLKHFLVEDRGNDGSTSYVDFLCHMHKEIRALLS